MDNQLRDAIYLFNSGKNEQAYKFLGAHFNPDGGYIFRVWAPNARDVSVIGDFNAWEKHSNPMSRLEDTGIWEAEIKEASEGQCYKFCVTGQNGYYHYKSDPFAFKTQFRPDNASILYSPKKFNWTDEKFLIKRPHARANNFPLNIYELHLGSWKKHPDGRFYNFREAANHLAAYCQEMGYTHVELMPIMEHPLDASWGYQVTSYFAPSARHGDISDLQYFVNHLHNNNIGVILDFVPAHFPKDDFALISFDGSPCFEHYDPRLAEQKEWGTMLFDWGKTQVRSFLFSSAMYFIENFHIDGLRFDAVSTMLYRNYSEASYVPNQFGGRENIEGINFLKELCYRIGQKHPQVLLMAEEATTFGNITKEVEQDGLGFHYKWDMGWMHDTLDYFSKDPIYRPWHHHWITFSMSYGFSERFLLSLSHDEVVHGKKSIIDRMPGDLWRKFAQVRLLYAYMIGHPGGKLSFMGMEIGQHIEWRFYEELEWFLLKYPLHRQLQDFFKKMNHMYLATPALYERDTDWTGFKWIDADDIKRSTYSFMRQDNEGNQLYFVLNMTPSPIDEFSIKVEQAGDYELLLNSDDPIYGGSGYWLIYNDNDRKRFEESKKLTTFSSYLSDDNQWILYDEAALKKNMEKEISSKKLKQENLLNINSAPKQHHLHFRLPGFACLIFSYKQK